MENAKQLQSIYFPGYKFSDWVLDTNLWNTFNFKDTLVFYYKTDSLTDVKRLMTEREPCNISYRKLYYKDELKKAFNYEVGAYDLSTKDKLMPNIAVYCYGTFKLKHTFKNIHVLNLIGLAFDYMKQPDYIYYFNSNKTYDDIIEKYNKIWNYALVCAKYLKSKNKIHKIKIYNVGGGAFAGPITNFIETIFEPSFLPLVNEFKKHNIEILGYDFKKKEFNGGFIPTIFEDSSEDVEHTLYINAWDPYSIIGNGNGSDRSLDGYYGRSSNMSVLGWSITNPYLTYVYI